MLIINSDYSFQFITTVHNFTAKKWHILSMHWCLIYVVYCCKLAIL